MLSRAPLAVEWKVSEHLTDYREATRLMQLRAEKLARQRTEQAELEQAELEQAELEQAKLEQAKLEQANLERSAPEQAKLERAAPEQAKLERAAPEQAKLEQAKLEQAELVWLLEHPPLVSLGRSGCQSDILPHNRLPVIHSSRGGQTTCHAPGQSIVYFVLDLRGRSLPIRAFVEQVGAWIIETLATWGIEARADKEAIGVWVGSRKPAAQKIAAQKIAAMGFRVSRGIVTHGVSINRAIDLSLYRGIVACGQGGEEVATSMEREGVKVSREELERRLKETCPFL